MPLENYLIPGEEIRYHTTRALRYGAKRYELIVTNKRLLLYAQRGVLIKNDDVVSFKLDEIQGINYRETGMVGKRGHIIVESRTRIDLEGDTSEVRALYQQLMQFF